MSIGFLQQKKKNSFKTENDILDTNGSEIDFDNTVDQYNVIVFDNTIPSMADQTQRIGTLDVYFYDHPEWNVSISDVTAKGQGTSSMKYWIWNTRYQLDKNLSVITHADGSTSKKVWQMVPWIPAGQKFTAKKNFASSMQSHKIGAVNSYTDLYKQVGLSNEAMQREGYSDVRVSVYELPFFCFEKSINDDGEPVYVFKGLYTFGPDKGDKYTFGYDTDYFPDLLSIEGSDNSPLLTLFRVPWNTDSGRVVYDEDKEAWQYNGANSFGFGAGDIANIVNWIPTYNHVYQCSPRLLPFDGTPDELNDDLDIYRTQPYEFWIAKVGDSHRFDVYYYEASVGLFIPSDIGEGPINLVSQLVDKDYGLASADIENKTNDSLNTLFINARVAKFRKEAALYWDIDDCLYFMNNVEFNAGTDERAKNTYPYSFGIETSKWRWRVDDADTRFDTTNRGLPDKEYSVETHDLDETGAAVWNGETNNFFNLMELAFPEEKIISMRKSMAAMQSLGGLKSGNDLEKIYAFYKKYFFDQAQEYFPSDGYNADAKYCYENGKLAYNAGIYSNDTDPITQSLGDHYLAEQRWITKRILYMMSKYNFGLFSASGTDTITVRAAGNTIKYQLTPAMDMYPAIANGTSIIQGKRTKAGEVCEMEIELSGSGDQQNAIQGASYLQDIGDWYNKNVTGSMIIQGRMLRDIRLGSKNNPVIISISSLTLSNCVSLQRLLLSNITTLSGTLNLTACEHLQEIYADGTSLAQIVLPSGGGLRVVEYSRFNQYLSLSNYPLLTDDGIGIDLCKTVISDFFIVDCALVRPMKILVDIMNAQMEQGDNHALKRIRAVGFEESYNNSFILDKLVDLTNGTYSGLSSEGLSGEDELPVLDGTLNINASVYGDTVEALRAMFTRLTLNINGEFYVRFADDIVTMLCAENWGDGIGTSKRQMGNITELGIIFAGTGIKSFKELSLSKIESLTNEFTGCSQLSSIAFPETLRILNTTAFAGSMVALDLSDCTHITDLLIDSDDTIDFMPSANDNLVNITYNNGSSCIHMVGYSNAILTINNESEIVDFWVENCNTNNNILSKIQSIYSVKEHLLKYIRAVGFDEEFYTNEILKTLLSLAENGYRGINESGERDDNIIPVLSGKVLCTDKYSPDMLYDLKSYFPNILFNMTGEACVDFKDQVVKDICVRNWGSDGELTVEQAAGITTINTKFKENLEITSFNELKYFTNANARTEYPGEPGVPYGAFDRCTNLESVTIMPTAKRIETSAFGGCSSLKKVLFPDSVYFLGTNIFYGCTSLESVNIPKGFADSKFPSNVFRDCISLTSLIEVPETVTIIGMATFNGCTSLAGVKLKGNVPPSLEYSVFGNSTFPIYVPEAAVNAYKSASGWTSLASRIMGY
ncbi:leucine-rich repeat domain-containing protein [Bacteroides thetaiotaomicron]|uniref:leucine-rich repeat domain-containing protein n=1 Tax=Bacteroides thetaiotaomicron TaxID=818 RepID=UPI0039C3AEAE